MEIEVGEYIRLDDGTIGKYQINKNWINVVETNDKYIGFDIENDIVKHSKNIIDLIGKDDYVNGCKVIDMCESQYGGEKIIYIGGFGIPKKIYDNQIKSILTKEQYEQYSYKI